MKVQYSTPAGNTTGRRRLGSRSMQWVIGQKQLSAAASDHRHCRRAYDGLKFRQVGTFNKKVAAIRREPERLELGIADEHVRSIGSVRSVVEVDAPIGNQQRSAIVVEKRRGEFVVVALGYQRTLRRL